jgi:hypothetical protein
MMVWFLKDERVKGTPADESGLRQVKSGLNWWEQLHHIYVLVALGGTLAGFAYGASFKEKILLIFLGGYVVVIALFSVWSAFVNGIKARYAPVLAHIHSGMHSLRNLRVFMRAEQFNDSSESQRLLALELTRVLDSLRSALEIVSGTTIECRIELVERPAATTNVEQLTSYPLARDSISSESRHHFDEDAKRTPHPVLKSTPYMALLNDDGPAFYFCGDVKGQQDFSCEYFTRFKNELRPRSMVVWPIRYRRRQTPGASAEMRSHEIVGFLHAESISRTAFNRRYDVQLGAAFADSMFDVLFSHFMKRKDVVHAIL